MKTHETRPKAGHVLLWSAGLLLACGVGGSGELRVLASGGDEARGGLASSELVDGWSIEFERYLVSLTDLRLSRDGELKAEGLQPARVVDLTTGVSELGVLEALPAGRLHLSYAIAPPGEDAVAVAGVDPEDLARMRADQLSYLVEGVATKPPFAPVRFRFGFSEAVTMEDCTNGVDGTQGVVIPASSRAEAELTLHVEHLFYDRLGTHTGVGLRFEALAAMADEQGLVTLDVLSEQPVLEPVGMDGDRLLDDDGTPVLYDPGTSSVTHVADFLRVSVRDQGHLNGSGLCTIVRNIG